MVISDAPCRNVYRNNPSAVLGNLCGGSNVPMQHGAHRPLPGICQGGASKTFLQNLYLSNSIHPNGQSGMASGYVAASEVAEDMEAREQTWWQGKASEWMFANPDKITVING